jgi:hypothetical protein
LIHTGAGYFDWFFGTETVVLFVETLPVASEQATVTV